MKRLLLLLLSSLFFITVSQAQIYKLSFSTDDQTYTTCKGQFTSRDYSEGFANNYEAVTRDITFCSGGGPLRINFDYCRLRTEYFNGKVDKLEIYDGPTVSGTPKWTLTGLNNEHVAYTSTGTCLTFRFVENGDGWGGINGGNVVSPVYPCGWLAFFGCPPSGCNGNLPASDVCSSAPVICNLDGYCGSTSGWYTADNVSTLEALTKSECSSGGWSIQNNSWLGFIASSTSATLTIKPSNCSDPAKGMQAVILETNNCTSFNVKSSCVYDGKSTFSLTASPLVIGKKYYVMIDGGYGNDCDYTVSANTGVTTVSVTSSASTICEGQSVTLTAIAPTGSTYKWLPGNLTSSSISVSPTNTTTYTCEVTGPCDQVQKPTVKITVKPAPVATATPSSQSLCSGGTTGISLTSSMGSTTYLWTATKTGGATTGSSSGTGSYISQTLNTTTITPGTVTYNVTPTSGGCSGNVLNVPVTVNPIPTLTVSPTSQTFCSGATTNIALTSNIAGTTYSWTILSSSGVNGASAGSGTTIAQTLNATGTVAGTVTYEVTPTSAAPANCPGSKKTVTITVNPRPVITPTATAQTICSGGSTSIGLQSDITGTTYTWTTAVTGGVTGASNGSGSNIVQTLNTFGTTVGTVEYTITATTPAPASCMNSSVTKVLVTVNPIPTISINTPAAICDGQSVNLTATVAPAGGTFLWTPGNLTTNPITVSPGTTTNYNLQYTVNNCSNSASRNVTVNPKPTVSINATSTTVCADKTTTLTASGSGTGTYSWAPGGSVNPSITVTPPVGNTTYTVTYTHTSTSCSQTATQAITGLSVPTVTVTPTATAICTGVSITLNTNVNPGGGTYSWFPGGATTPNPTVTPAVSTTYTLTYTASNGCSLSNSSAAITVTPLEDAGFSYAKSTYCGNASDTLPVITGKPGGTFSATPAGLVFLNTATGEIRPSTSALNTYAITYTTNGTCKGTKTVNLTIASNPTADFGFDYPSYCQYAGTVSPTFIGSSSAGIFDATPAGLVFVSANSGVIDLNTSTPGTYQVRNIIPKNGTCNADTSAWVPITITPAPVLLPSSKNDTVCTGNPTIVTLSGSNSYDWTVVAPPTITGASAVTGNTTGVIGQVLTSSAVVPGTVHYIITPKNTITTCVGKADSVHVTVNPIPTVSATPTTPSVCSGVVTDIKLTSNLPTAVFTWTVLSSTGATGANPGTGPIIKDILNATGSTPGTVVYQITPSAFGACNGTPIDVPVTVNPNPTTVVSIPSGDDTICSGEKTDINLSSTAIGTVFTWTVNQSGVSGGNSGTGNSITDSLVVLGTVPGKAVYTITGTANGCSGATAIDSIIVNPIPTLIVTPLKQEICSGAQTNIALVSNITPTTFIWTVTPNTITGASNGATGIGSIVQTLTNPGSVADTAIYHIVASAGGCLSSMSPLVDSVEAKIAVNPKPVISAATPLSICSGDTVNIPLSSNVAGAVFAYKATTATVVGAGDGSGSLIKQGLSVNVVSDSVVYTISAISEQGCVATPFKSVVQVNPRPVISFILSPGSSICSGTPVSAFLTTNVPGSVFTWTPRPSIVIGPKSGSGPNPSSFNDVLSINSDTAATVIYDVTASKGGCMNAAMSSLVQFTVNPLPKIIPSVTSATICDGDSVDIALSSNVPGTDFSWTVAQIDVTGAVADSGQTSIKQLLKLTGNGVGTATYAITAHSPVGCQNSSAFSLPVKVNPLENATFNYSSIKYCQSELNPSAIITGGATGTFSSQPLGLNIMDVNSGLVNLKGSVPGDYIIAFKTSGKCSQTSYQNIRVNANPQADTSSIMIGASNCGTNTGTITGITTASGTAPFKYEWKNSAGVIVDTTLVLDSVPPGFYTLTITDANGCKATVGNGNSLSINYLQTVTANFTSDVTSGDLPLDVQFTNQSTSTGVINYNWVFDNGTTSNVKDPAVTFNEIKTYNVCLYVDDGGKGCRDTLCAPIEVYTNSDITVVPNVFTPNGDGVNDILKITATGLGSVNAQIFNRWGQKEYEWNTLNGGWDGHSASGLPAVEGTYYIILYATGADKNKTVFPPIKQSFTLLR